MTPKHLAPVVVALVSALSAAAPAQAGGVAAVCGDKLPEGLTYDAATASLSSQGNTTTIDRGDGSWSELRVTGGTLTYVVRRPAAGYSSTLVVRADGSFVWSDSNGGVATGRCSFTP